MKTSMIMAASVAFAATILAGLAVAQGQNWPQYKFDARHSGNAPDHDLALPLGLVAALPLSDMVLTSPVVADGRVYAVDASGVAWCFDALSLKNLWKVETAGGKLNCNNVSSPAVAGEYVHFGTMAGIYYVLDAQTGKIVRQIDCGEPIFSSPVVGNGRVYFATLGAQVYALEPDGAIAWTWDFVKERLGLEGDRWSGTAWLEHLEDRAQPIQRGRVARGRVLTKDMFACTRDIALDDDIVVMSAGGTVVWLEDADKAALLRREYYLMRIDFGLSIGEDGTVYRQAHWTDNNAHVEILPPLGRTARARGQLELLALQSSTGMLNVGQDTEGQDYVMGTKSSTLGGLMSFSSVSLRGRDVYRCRVEEGFGLCRHSLDQQPPQTYAGCYPSTTPPVLLKDKVVYGGLDGALYVVPMSGGEAWSFPTAFGKAISAPAAVSDGRVYFGCEDGYLYVLGPRGNASLPARDLELWKTRSPLTGPYADARYNRFTSFANWANTNYDNQPIAPPLQLQWIRRYEGTAKHFSTFGGGRMYTHTAEGQVFAVEEETGRLLWRRYFPGVHISYTSPLYYQDRLLIPQAGLDQGYLRCLDAATGALLWEAPFNGSPGWARQSPPLVYKNLAIYMSSTGKYGPTAPEKATWLFGSGTFPGSFHPLVRAYDLDSGEEVWTADFSQYGSGGDDAGLCLMDGKLFYACCFGYDRRTKSVPHDVVAALDPQTGKVLWLTTKYPLSGACTISAQDGRLYLGGSDPPAGFKAHHVLCLDARDGALVWRSEDLLAPEHLVTIGPDFLFVNAHSEQFYLLDKQSGKIVSTLGEGYRCTRFTLNGDYLLGPNMDLIDVADPAAIRLVSTGPRLDPCECLSLCVSNGRLYYTGHGGGLQAGLVGSGPVP